MLKHALPSSDVVTLPVRETSKYLFPQVKHVLSLKSQIQHLLSLKCTDKNLDSKSNPCHCLQKLFQ
uniref:Uncharacterized protein n=1 Tax=Anguilla anguilla TaxID=7936 RepID=A0A0E9QI31_ANGAN